MALHLGVKKNKNKNKTMVLKMACKALHEGATHYLSPTSHFVTRLQNTSGEVFTLSVPSAWHALTPDIYLACHLPHPALGLYLSITSSRKPSMTTLYFYNTKHFSALGTLLHYADVLIC